MMQEDASRAHHTDAVSRQLATALQKGVDQRLDQTLNQLTSGSSSTLSQSASEEKVPQMERLSEQAQKHIQGNDLADRIIPFTDGVHPTLQPYS